MACGRVPPRRGESSDTYSLPHAGLTRPSPEPHPQVPAEWLPPHSHVVAEEAEAPVGFVTRSRSHLWLIRDTPYLLPCILLTYCFFWNSPW